MTKKPSNDYVPDLVNLPDWQKEELDRRLEAFRRNPEAGSSWEEIRKRTRRGEGPS